MAWGQWIQLGDGTVVHVLHSGRRPQPRPQCVMCGAASTKLCDFPLKHHGTGATCDAPICDAHAKSIGANRDLCPRHAAAWEGKS